MNGQSMCQRFALKCILSLLLLTSTLNGRPELLHSPTVPTPVTLLALLTDSTNMLH
jgi:hypothetical protein